MLSITFKIYEEVTDGLAVGLIILSFESPKLGVHTKEYSGDPWVTEGLIIVLIPKHIVSNSIILIWGISFMKNVSESILVPHSFVVDNKISKAPIWL